MVYLSVTEQLRQHGMKIEDDDYQYSLEAMLAHALKVNGGKPISEKRRKE